jgi:hypothetical protein
MIERKEKYKNTLICELYVFFHFAIILAYFFTRPTGKQVKVTTRDIIPPKNTVVTIHYNKFTRKGLNFFLLSSPLLSPFSSFLCSAPLSSAPLPLSSPYFFLSFLIHFTNPTTDEGIMQGILHLPDWLGQV